MDPLFIALAAILLGLLYLLKEDAHKKEIMKAVEQFPGPKRYPFLGTNLCLLSMTKEEIFQKNAARIKTYGRIHRTWVGSIPVIQLCTCDSIELILNNSVQITKGATYRFIQPWLLEGLLTSTGAYWHKNRKLITPTFHFKILEQFIEVFDEKSQQLVELLRPKTKGQVFDVYPDVTRCALDIICETAMGISVNAMKQPNSEYVSAVYGASTLSTDRILVPWLHSDLIYYRTAKGKRFQQYLETLHGFTEKVIRERKTKLADSGNNVDSNEDDVIGKKKRMAFLDMLLAASEDGQKMTDLEIRQEVDTFMFEGHDTTAAAMCWALFMLGNNPDVEEKAYEEQQRIFCGEDRPVTMKDLGEMKYLERIIKETLRLYPSVPTISRILSDDIVLEGIKIPKGVSVAIQIYHIHHDPNIYPDPEKFDPDRFLPENSVKRHPFAYLPFSAGPRNCIGQKFALLEEKTVLSTIIRNFKIHAAEKPSDIKLMSELILRPKSGIKLSLTERC